MKKCVLLLLPLMSLLISCVVMCAAASLHAAEGSLPANSAATEATYVLGPEDQLSVHVVDLDDISEKPVRIDPNGYIELPLVGRLHAAGLTVEQLRTALARQAAKYINSPQITINVLEYRSQPVSILGEVNNPGLHHLQGPTHLVNVISLAGGLKPDAGQKVTITRRVQQGTLPLFGSHLDASGDYSVAYVRLGSLLDGSNPSANIEVRANDVISVAHAEMVYVVGNVKKSGGISINSADSMSITQALSLAEGTAPGAAPRKARILRAVDGKPSNKDEVPVDLSMVLSGKAPDLQLHANDVLFVPDNVPASAMKRATEAAIQMATGALIYRH
jgi:polysaccharide biosynthesis/export protein